MASAQRDYKKRSHQIRNYRIMLLANGIGAFASQLLGPFFVIFIQQKGGGIENMGILFGFSLLVTSVTSYFFGRASDLAGRRQFLIGSSIAGGALTVLYLYTQNLFQLYALQFFSGINIAVWAISEKAFMADITKKKTRGRELGFYDMILGILASVGLMTGGYAIGAFGFKIIFWVVGIILSLSGLLFGMIKEK